MAQTTITGFVKDVSGAVLPGCKVRFTLVGQNANVARVNGVAWLPTGTGTMPSVDLIPNSVTGAVSGSIYSNDVDITVAGQTGVTWYMLETISPGGGTSGSIPVKALSGTTLDITNVTPLTTTPVATAPTGDSTYARLDGGNTPFTAIIQFLQGIILGAGKILAWGSSGTSVVDTGMSRTAAKVIAIGDGTQGNSTGSLALGGAIVAATGAIRMAQGSGISVRNSGNTADQNLISSTGANTVNIGANNEINTSGTVTITASGAARIALCQNPAFSVLGLRSDGALGFSSTTSPNGVADAMVSRAGVNTVQIGVTGTTPDASGTVSAANIAQPAATAFIIKDNQGGTRYSIPSGGVAAATLNNTNVTGASTLTQVSCVTGVSQGSGLKHQRFGSACTTAAAAGATCTTTYNWTSAFADANYTPVCTAGPPSNGTALWSISGFVASGVTVILTSQGLASTIGSFTCIGIHD